MLPNQSIVKTEGIHFFAIHCPHATEYFHKHSTIFYIDKFVSIWLWFAGNIYLFPSRMNVCLWWVGYLGFGSKIMAAAAVEPAMLSSLLQKHFDKIDILFSLSINRFVGIMLYVFLFLCCFYMWVLIYRHRRWDQANREK